MPQFEVHDSETGLKLLVEGPAPPTDAESEALIQSELAFLTTNLYRGPSNRFMLDVGPLQPQRRMVDSLMRVGVGSLRTEEAIKNTAKRFDEIIAQHDFRKGKLDVHGMYERIYQEELAKLPKDEAPGISEATLSKLPENSLLLISHGSPSGQLSTEGGQDFTLHNVAQVLGASSNAVNTIINTACYGGQCEPPDYQSAFPNVTSIQHHAFDAPNIISLDRLANAEYFFTNAVPGLWERAGTNWVEKPVETNPITGGGK